MDTRHSQITPYTNSHKGIAMVTNLAQMGSVNVEIIANNMGVAHDYVREMSQ